MKAVIRVFGPAVVGKPEQLLGRYSEGNISTHYWEIISAPAKIRLTGATFDKGENEYFFAKAREPGRTNIRIDFILSEKGSVEVTADNQIKIFFKEGWSTVDIERLVKESFANKLIEFSTKRVSIVNPDELSSIILSGGYDSVDLDTMFIPPEPGLYSFRLTVGDNAENVDSDSISIIVTEAIIQEPLPPSADYIWSYLPDFWNWVREKEIYSTFWSAAIQAVAKYTLDFVQSYYERILNEFPIRKIHRFLPIKTREKINDLSVIQSSNYQEVNIFWYVENSGTILPSGNISLEELIYTDTFVADRYIPVGTYIVYEGKIAKVIESEHVFSAGQFHRIKIDRPIIRRFDYLGSYSLYAENQPNFYETSSMLWADFSSNKLFSASEELPECDTAFIDGKLTLVEFRGKNYLITASSFDNSLPHFIDSRFIIWSDRFIRVRFLPVPKVYQKEGHLVGDRIYFDDGVPENLDLFDIVAPYSRITKIEKDYISITTPEGYDLPSSPFTIYSKAGKVFSSEDVLTVAIYPDFNDYNIKYSDLPEILKNFLGVLIRFDSLEDYVLPFDEFLLRSRSTNFYNAELLKNLVEQKIIIAPVLRISPDARTGWVLEDADKSLQEEIIAALDDLIAIKNLPQFQPAYLFKKTNIEISEKILNIPALQEKWTEPENIKFAGRDFSYENGILKIHFDFSSDYLWALYAKEDNSQALYDNFGIIVGLPKSVYDEPEKYLNKVRSLFFILFKGPTLSVLKTGANVFANYPFVYDSGVISEIDEDYSSDSIYVRIGEQIYLIPKKLGLGKNPKTGKKFAVNDFVEQFTPLVEAVNIFDNVSDPDRVSVYFPDALFAGVIEISHSEFCDTNSITLYPRFLKKYKTPYADILVSVLQSKDTQIAPVAAFEAQPRLYITDQLHSVTDYPVGILSAEAGYEAILVIDRPLAGMLPQMDNGCSIYIFYPREYLGIYQIDAVDGHIITLDWQSVNNIPETKVYFLIVGPDGKLKPYPPFLQAHRDIFDKNEIFDSKGMGITGGIDCLNFEQLIKFLNGLGIDSPSGFYSLNEGRSPFYFDRFSELNISDSIYLGLSYNIDDVQYPLAWYIVQGTMQRNVFSPSNTSDVEKFAERDTVLITDSSGNKLVSMVIAIDVDKNQVLLLDSWSGDNSVNAIILKGLFSCKSVLEFVKFYEAPGDLGHFDSIYYVDPLQKQTPHILIELGKQNSSVLQSKFRLFQQYSAYCDVDFKVLKDVHLAAREYVSYVNNVPVDYSLDCLTKGTLAEDEETVSITIPSYFSRAK